MRIGIDAREAFRPEPRGVGLYTRHMLQALGTLAPEHEFLLYHELPRPAGLELAPNQRALRVDAPGSRFHLWERLHVPARMRKDRLDVYHGTYNTLPPRWRLWPGPPMVVTIHDVIVTYWPDDLADPFVRYARKVTRRVVRDATRILTVSEWSKRDLCERFQCDPDKVRVARNGLDPRILAGAPPGAGDGARQRHAGGRPYLFAIGGALERKNTGRLIDAFGMLCARRDLPHVLLISGVKKQTDRFRERAAAAGVADRVHLLPYVATEELVALYAGAALTVYPSNIEGWGMPVSESLALGTPVATSNTSAMPEAGGAFACYFEPTSTESIAATIERALDHDVPAFAARRDAAIAFARELTWQHSAQLVLQTYCQVPGTFFSPASRAGR